MVARWRLRLPVVAATATAAKAAVVEATTVRIDSHRRRRVLLILSKTTLTPIGSAKLIEADSNRAKWSIGCSSDGR